MSASRKKIIMVGAYGIRFDQRSRGEESPYWQGTIFKDGEPVGYFKNDGCGGPTLISPETIADDFRKMVDDIAPALAKNYRERADVILTYAEILGYDRKAAALNPPYTLAELVKQYENDFAEFDTKFSKHAAAGT